MKLSIKKVISLFFGCFILLFNFTLTKAAETPKIDTEKIDKYIEKAMKDGHIPGLSLGIVQGDKVVYLRGYGIADSNKNAVTPQTSFHTGSIGKTFTALAIRQLVNENKVEYNATVEKYIPWFHTADTSVGSKITINNLINHTSGFSRNQGSLDYLYDGRYSIEDLVRKATFIKPDNPIGTTEYSNLNYIILGLIIEKVTNQPYEEYVKENIFNPLNMNNSFFSDQEASTHSPAIGHKVSFGFLVPYKYKNYPKGSVPAGFEICSAEDFTHYMIAYLNNGYYNNISLIPNNSLAKPIDETDSYKNGHYNVYWDIEQGLGLLGHSGADNYFYTSMLINPKLKYGVITLTNSRSDGLTPGITATDISNGIMNLLAYGNTAPLNTATIAKTYNKYNILFIVTAILLLFQLIRLKNYKRRVANSKINISLHFLIYLLVNITIPISLLIYSISVEKIDFTKIVYRTQLYGIDYTSILLLYMIIFLVIAILKTLSLCLIYKNRKTKVP
jgi:CubicO group peptidase (beta-lactamase class C family)